MLVERGLVQVPERQYFFRHVGPQKPDSGQLSQEEGFALAERESAHWSESTVYSLYLKEEKKKKKKITGGQKQMLAIGRALITRSALKVVIFETNPRWDSRPSLSKEIFRR